MLQDARRYGFAMTSWGQIPEHLRSCIHRCIIVLGVSPHGASWPVQNPHILSLLFWPPDCVCFWVSRKKGFLVVSLCVPCSSWHEPAAFIVIQIWESLRPIWTGTLESKFRDDAVSHPCTFFISNAQKNCMCLCGKIHTHLVVCSGLRLYYDTKAVIRAVVGWSGWRRAVWAWQTYRQSDCGIWLWSLSLQLQQWRYVNRTWSEVSAKACVSG